MTSLNLINKTGAWENYQMNISAACVPDELASVVGHELRTPLTSIRAALGLLLSGKVDINTQQSQRLLEIALNNTDRLVRLTKAIENQPEAPIGNLSAAAIARFQMETELRSALERREFQLEYQPIVSLDTGKITGFEALVRWQSPHRGMVSPAEFIPLAEESGLIKPLGAWVLREACRQLSSWQQQFPSNPALTMSVNLSSIQLSQPDLVEQIQQICQETSVAAGSLRLEVTESSIMENQLDAIAALKQLKAMGIQLYMDDFGTGYSSLSRLHDLPIDVLKIDRSFVQLKRWDIIWTVMILALSLGLEVIAEGVETAEQQTQLQRLGCMRGQGYFFSKPVNSEAATALITASMPVPL